MILRALLIGGPMTFNQIVDAIGQKERVRLWHETDRLENKGMIVAVPTPELSGEYKYWLTEKGKAQAYKEELEKPIQRSMFE